MDRAVSTLEAAVAGGHTSLARRALGTISDEAEREAVLEVLARHAARGSALATELLVEAVDRFGVARRVVRNVLRDEAAVPDVVQNTLITLVQAIGTFRGDATFTTWLQHVAHDQAADHLRRVRAAEAREVVEPGPAQHLSALVAARQAVRQLLDRLPPRYRDAVLLRDVEHLPYAEVAIRLGRNLDTTKAHVARGRALLAGLVDQQGPA